MATDETPLTATRRTLHVVAEHVLLPDLYDATGRIGLHPAPGGFTTPPYAHPGGFTRQLRVEGTEVVDRRDGRPAGRVSLASPRTLAEVWEVLDVATEAPADVYDLGSDGAPDQELVADPASATLVATLFAVADQALTALRDQARAEPGRVDPAAGTSAIHLWPEHFDLACSIDRVTYGASPGDASHPTPHLYAVPWELPGGDRPGHEPVRARYPALPVPAVDDALTWYQAVRAATTTR